MFQFGSSNSVILPGGCTSRGGVIVCKLVVDKESLSGGVVAPELRERLQSLTGSTIATYDGNVLSLVPLHIDVKNASCFHNQLCSLRFITNHLLEDPELVGKYAEGALHKPPCTQQSVVVHVLLSRQVSSWIWPHLVSQQRRGLVSHSNMWQGAKLFCTWEMLIKGQVEPCSLAGLAKHWIWQYTIITAPAICSNVNQTEPEPCINNSQKDNQEGPLVVVEKRTWICWSLDNNVFAIHSSNAVWEVPQLPLVLCNCPSVNLCGSKHEGVQRVIKNGFPYLSDNPTQSGHTHPVAVGDWLVGIPSGKISELTQQYYFEVLLENH